MIKINCQYSIKNSLCKNTNVKRGFFGFGPRVCVEYGTDKVCEFKKQYPKPPATPAPPPPKR